MTARFLQNEWIPAGIGRERGRQKETLATSRKDLGST